MSTRRLAMVTHDTSRASAFEPASHARTESPAGYGIGQACCQVTWCPNCSGPAAVSAIRREPGCSLRVVIAALELSWAADSLAAPCRWCCSEHLGSLQQAGPSNSRRNSQAAAAPTEPGKTTLAATCSMLKRQRRQCLMLKRHGLSAPAHRRRKSRMRLLGSAPRCGATRRAPAMTSRSGRCSTGLPPPDKSAYFK